MFCVLFPSFSSINSGPSWLARSQPLRPWASMARNPQNQKMQKANIPLPLASATYRQLHVGRPATPCMVASFVVMSLTPSASEVLELALAASTFLVLSFFISEMHRTVPAVSFTTSHRALAMKSSRMLYGKDMTSTERIRAAWDEMPFWQMHMSIADRHAWIWKERYELGLRDTNRNSKLKICMYYTLHVILWVNLFNWNYPLLHYIFKREWPSWMLRENSRAEAQRWGTDVYFADGKFTKPYFHINPPALTIKADEV